MSSTTTAKKETDWKQASSEAIKDELGKMIDGLVEDSIKIQEENMKLKEENKKLQEENKKLQGGHAKLCARLKKYTDDGVGERVIKLEKIIDTNGEWTGRQILGAEPCDFGDLCGHLQDLMDRLGKAEDLNEEHEDVFEVIENLQDIMLLRGMPASSCELVEAVADLSDKAADMEGCDDICDDLLEVLKIQDRADILKGVQDLKTNANIATQAMEQFIMCGLRNCGDPIP